jgi:hypothetical protein
MLVPTFHKCVCSIQFSTIEYDSVLESMVSLVPFPECTTWTIAVVSPRFGSFRFVVTVAGEACCIGRRTVRQSFFKFFCQRPALPVIFSLLS